MPQPKQQTPDADEQTPKPDPYAEFLDRLHAIPEGDRTTPQRQILRAATMEKERSGLMERISSNREFLRLMAKNDELSADEQHFLNVFYPEKEKGERRDSDEIEATRKARESARKR